MTHSFKLINQPSPNALGGTVGVKQIREFSFQGNQFI